MKYDFRQTVVVV